MTAGTRPVRVAVASGKGGTGKTTVAVNLAATAARRGIGVAYADCDVEEPNGHIYLHPRIERTGPVTVPVPVIAADRCTGCRLCSRICAFNAVAVLADTAIVFPELCHGCGGCSLVCPADAVTETERETGMTESGTAGAVPGAPVPLGFVHGRLKIGEAMPLPVIRAVKRLIPPADLVFVDCPPGNACALVESVTGSDLLLLVTEPTPFGVHDLDRVLDTAVEMSLPAAVVINRSGPADGLVLDLCGRRGVPVLACIPESREWAVAGSNGLIAALEVPGAGALMEGLLDEVLVLVSAEADLPDSTAGKGTSS